MGGLRAEGEGGAGCNRPILILKLKGFAGSTVYDDGDFRGRTPGESTGLSRKLLDSERG